MLKACKKVDKRLTCCGISLLQFFYNQEVYASKLQNKSNLLRLYTKHCRKIKKPILLFGTFKKILNDFDFTFQKLRKDKCVLCEMVQFAQTMTKSEKLLYTNHLIEKKATRHYMEATRQRAEADQPHIDACFDLEKLLSTPHREGMLIGFCRKNRLATILQFTRM